MRDSERLPRRERIASRRNFLQAYSQGRKTHTRHAVIFVFPNSTDHPRLGITVTRKVGKAVARNRIKRRVREIYRRNLRQAIPDGIGVDLVLNMRRSSAKASFTELEQDLTKAFRTITRRLAGSDAGA